MDIGAQPRVKQTNIYWAATTFKTPSWGGGAGGKDTKAGLQEAQFMKL